MSMVQAQGLENELLAPSVDPAAHFPWTMQPKPKLDMLIVNDPRSSFPN